MYKGLIAQCKAAGKRKSSEVCRGAPRRESIAEGQEEVDAGAEVRIDAAYAEHLFVDSGVCILHHADMCIAPEHLLIQTSHIGHCISVMGKHVMHGQISERCGWA